MVCDSFGGGECAGVRMGRGQRGEVGGKWGGGGERGLKRVI